ncbi:MAG: hypothetical protein WCX97_01795 [Candidatus Magasanikbacteria bacterium]
MKKKFQNNENANMLTVKDESIKKRKESAAASVAAKPETNLKT